MLGILPWGDLLLWDLSDPLTDWATLGQITLPRRILILVGNFVITAVPSKHYGELDGLDHHHVISESAPFTSSWMLETPLRVSTSSSTIQVQSNPTPGKNHLLWVLTEP